MYKKLKLTDLECFISCLGKENKVIAPVQKGKSLVFEEVKNASKIELDYTRTINAAKKICFPAKEVICEFKLGEEIKAINKSEKTVLLGAHYCDISGIKNLDAAFSNNFKDENYMSKREKLTILGVSCKSDKYCYCESLEISKNSGYDAFMHKLEDTYIIEVLTEKGKNLLTNCSCVSDSTEDELKKAKEQTDKSMKNSTELKIKGAKAIKEAIENKYDSEEWENIAKDCLSCGACNMVCPTCYCFDVIDDLKLKDGLKSGTRTRIWDGCHLQDFALVAGNHNFRPQRTERLKHFYFHKHNYLVKKLDQNFCTGCGRCSTACKAEINSHDVLNKIL